MGQLRNKTGVDFEFLVCETNGWRHVPKSPKIDWTGNGRSNFDKIASVGFDVNKFTPTSYSVYEKYDAIKPNGDKVEIKKYKKLALDKWKVYSEPIFKVASRETADRVARLFGSGDMKRGTEKYNEFVASIVGKIGQDILYKITQSNIGVQLQDGFIPQSELEYQWKVYKGWRGFNRLSIEFRIKTI